MQVSTCFMKGYSHHSFGKTSHIWGEISEDEAGSLPLPNSLKCAVGMELSTILNTTVLFCKPLESMAAGTNERKGTH